MAGKKKKPPIEKFKAFWKKDPQLKRVAEHLGKFIDRMTAEDLINLLAAGFCAYGGYNAGASRNYPTETNVGLAGSALVAYQLAKSPNIFASSGAGVYLGALGLMNIPWIQGLETMKPDIKTEPLAWGAWEWMHGVAPWKFP